MFITTPHTTLSASSLRKSSKKDSTPSTKICTASLQSLDTFLNYTCVSNHSFSKSTTDPASRQVCDNVGDHLIGNVYARYEWETEAQTAVDKLNDRWYAGAYFLCVDAFSGIHLSVQADRYTPSSPPLRISAKLAADRMRTASVTAAVSATSCTSVSRPRSSFLRCATASALNVGSTLQRFKEAEVAGNHRNARVVEGGVPVRNVRVVAVVMEKIGGRVNRPWWMRP